MKSALTQLCFILLLAAAAQGAQLTSVQSSYHAYGNFAILVLRFDGDVEKTVQALEDGSAALVILPELALSPKASSELAAARNKLLKNARVETGIEGLKLRLDFVGPMKLSVSDTRNPYSIVLDFTPLENAGLESPSSEKLPGKAILGSIKKKRTPPSPPPATGSVEYYIALGKRALADKKEAVALDYLGKALRLQTDSPEVHYLLGLMQRKWNQPEQAISHFLQAKADSSFLPQAATELASLYHQLGRTSDEVAEWESFFGSMKNSYSLPDSLPDAGEIVSTPTSADAMIKTTSVTTNEDKTPESKVNVPSNLAGSPSIFSFFPWALVVLLSTGIVLLYRKQRDLNRTIELFVESESEPVSKPSAVEEQPRAVEPFVPDAPRPPAPAEPRGAEETAKEVLGLYKAGMSMPGIAERLGIGQDEVRLILNLQRDDGKN